MDVDESAPRRSRRAVFVYYKVGSRAAGTSLEQAFVAMRAAVRPWQAQLMRRDESGASSGKTATWMEVYWPSEGEDRDAPALEAAIEALAAEAGIVGLIDGERHYEVFQSCA